MSINSSSLPNSPDTDPTTHSMPIKHLSDPDVTPNDGIFIGSEPSGCHFGTWAGNPDVGTMFWGSPVDATDYDRSEAIEIFRKHFEYVLFHPESTRSDELREQLQYLHDHALIARNDADGCHGEVLRYYAVALERHDYDDLRDEWLAAHQSGTDSE